MAYSQHPITVDGVSLDTVAWNVETKTRAWSGSRVGDVVVPGVDGVLASVDDDLEPSTWTLSMWLLGTDTSGVIPGGQSAMSQCKANLDALSHLFLGRRHALLDVRETVDLSATQRQAWCKVTDAIVPEVRAGGRGRFTVVLQVPEGCSQDVSTADWTQASVVSGNTYEVTTLQGGTAPVNDAVILVTGPATNPRVTDAASSAYVQLNAALTSGQAWRVNSGTWATRYGAGLTLGSADTDGTDGDPSTIDGGGNARLLRMLPVLSTGLRRVRLTVTGSGFTSATALSVRARRRFFQ